MRVERRWEAVGGPNRRTGGAHIGRLCRHKARRRRRHSLSLLRCETGACGLLLAGLAVRSWSLRSLSRALDRGNARVVVADLPLLLSALVHPPLVFVFALLPTEGGLFFWAVGILVLADDVGVADPATSRAEYRCAARDDVIGSATAPTASAVCRRGSLLVAARCQMG